MRIKEITEGLSITPDDALNFDYDSSEGVSTKLGKGKFQPFLRKDKSVEGYSVYSVYSFKGETTTDVLLALKKKNKVRVNDSDYQNFIKRTAIFISAKMLMPLKIDCIITPKSSTAILNDVIGELRLRNPHIQFFPESYIKTADLSKIEIDTNNEKITPAIAKSLSGMLKTAVQTGKFEIKKALPQYRKFFRNFFEVVDPAILEKLANKNVCVMDDVLSSGTTLLEIMRSVSVYAPHTVVGLTLFKTK